MGLVSYKVIYDNLRRTSEKGLISLLSKKQLEVLSCKYFGDENGNYTCPYSGKVISEGEIILEHIIPVYSGGGTVLFNCVPASSETNSPSEKGAKHLIDWWVGNPKYWDENGPKRLEKLINYMLEAYEVVFENYTIDEVNNSYIDFLDDDNELSEFDEKEHLEVRVTIEEEKELRKQAQNNQIHSYLGFILDCVSVLEEYKINTQQITNKLYDLQRKGIFSDVEKYQIYQNKMQEIIKSIVGVENTSYLTYSINIDIKRLIDSINKDSIEDSLNELKTRLDFINRLLSANNVSMIDYFKSLKDIVDVDILYKPIESLTKFDKILFVENIKVGLDTKISIFIEMLNKGNGRILIRGNQETLEGYPNIKLSNFWSHNKDKIKDKLFNKLKDNLNYEKARNIVDIFELSHDTDKKISIFIEMLTGGNDEILSQRTQHSLEGYPSIKLTRFWNFHKEKIRRKLFEELKDNPEYDVARMIIDAYEVDNDIDKKITIFIEMLNEGNNKILRQGNQEVLEGYPKIKLSNFWQAHKKKIRYKLFEELKDKQEYEVARKIVDEYELFNDMDKKITIFIEMLNAGNSKILKVLNQETLEGYPNVKLSQFWSQHKERIKHKLLEELKDDPRYNVARNIIDEFETNNDIDKKVQIYIDMLNDGNNEILSQRTKQTLKGYPSIKLGKFWELHKEKVKEKLFGELKDDPKYNVARQLVDEFEVYNDINKKILIFIEMLNKGNSKILKQGNQETLEGYPNIKLATFWSDHKEEIKEMLFEELKDNPTYDTARKVVDAYEVKTSVDKKVLIFIEMLNKGNTKILKSRNHETLEGYPEIGLASFWSNYKDKVEVKLFKELKDNPKYEIARQLVRNVKFKKKQLCEVKEKKQELVNEFISYEEALVKRLLRKVV